MMMMTADEILKIVQKQRPGYRVISPSVEDLTIPGDFIFVSIESPSSFRKTVAISKSKRKIIGERNEKN